MVSGIWLDRLRLQWRRPSPLDVQGLRVLSFAAGLPREDSRKIMKRKLREP
jgi:hypothetical protein